ncbi:hypothetical protein GG804_02150 [Sphingomonas histidinilytica]|uniref:hypothetical protein n=1 Tax=Rhizorhabdus histidinilytica TaxID=439228 RepID=UPI001ADC6841|nr:hypothetical protein [Rhizorhabdus histidinilytica]MBO9375557.1 hypothetical protein [Rhizorhabdus histidinilytica]
MTDHVLKSGFRFACAAREAALAQKALLACDELARMERRAPSTASLPAAFPPIDPADLWSGFRAIFAGPDYPHLGAERHLDTGTETARIVARQSSSG